jgi:hypothetical protein
MKYRPQAVKRPPSLTSLTTVLGVVERMRMARRPTTIKPYLRTFGLVVLAASVAGCSSGSNSPKAVATAPPTPSSGLPAYSLVNDSGGVVSVTTCGPSCPPSSLAPGARLDFEMGFGVVRVARPGRKTTCLHVMNGLRSETPMPRQTVSVVHGTGDC